MTILTLNRKEFEKKCGKVTKEIEEKITMMGTPVEYVNENELAVEVFPNRPDLLCLQNFALAFNQYQEKSGIAEVKILPAEKDFIVVVDKSVKKVRPYTVCAIVKNLKLNNDMIKEIIDLQEKMHGSIGRKRKKIALGIYPLDKIKLPIKFKADAPENIKFQPLEAKRELTAKQILKEHFAGKEYGNLLKGFEQYPVFVDGNNKILSLPPLINSEETGRISESTKEIFIECSGHNLHYLKKCLSILALFFHEIGASIYAMQIKDYEKGNFLTPDMAPEKMEFKIADINKTLGMNFEEKQIKRYLAKMGIGYLNEKAKTFALIPAYRTDILHWIDLTEEVAIAHGYNNFEPDMPKISTIAYEDSVYRKQKLIANILTGLGLIETSSFHLTTKKNIKKMHYDFNEFIDIENSKTEKDALRIDLLTNHLQIFSENSDSQYPQKIFELGRVFALDKSGLSETGVKETEKLCISLTDEKATFTDLKQILDYLFKMLNLEYKIENAENNGYIIGRCGKIIVNNKEIGYVGEIAPRVLKNWKIKMPVVALEIDADLLIN